MAALLIRFWAGMLLLALPRAGSAQTLREVLHEFELPPGPGGPADLDRRITSYSAESWDDLFVIAFFAVGPDGDVMSDTLRVSALDRGTMTWTHAFLERRRRMAPEWDVGTVVGIRHSTGQIFLETHTNPSAGTVIVLTRALRPVTALEGWLLKLLPTGKAFFHRSMPHFVAAHPAELWSWDPRSGRETRVYPGEPYDSIRQRYIATTRSRYQQIGAAWFREHNHPMDAEHFGSSIKSRIRTDEAGTTAIFLVQFGEESDMPVPTPVLDVVVTCRGVGTGAVRCREVELKTLQARHPGKTTTRILDDLIAQLEPGGPPPD